jgi:hypothetical protein
MIEEILRLRLRMTGKAWLSLAEVYSGSGTQALEMTLRMEILFWL